MRRKKRKKRERNRGKKGRKGNGAGGLRVPPRGRSRGRGIRFGGAGPARREGGSLRGAHEGFRGVRAAGAPTRVGGLSPPAAPRRRGGRRRGPRACPRLPRGSGATVVSSLRPVYRLLGAAQRPRAIPHGPHGCGCVNDSGPSPVSRCRCRYPVSQYPLPRGRCRGCSG